MSFLNKKLLVVVGTSVVLACILAIFSVRTPHQKTKIAIANWGPHSSLEETIHGLKDGLAQAGFKENEQVQYDISHVNFDPSLIGQMIAKLKAAHPSVLVAMATPVAQRAKADVKDIPVVFTNITDPIEAGLVDADNRPHGNVTGVSERQDLDSFIDFAKKFLPQATRIGMLFATAEANDRALVKMMESAAAHHSMLVLAIPVDEPRDIPVRMQKFRNAVDFIYVGTSGPIQPSLPAIISEADRMQIPVFNADSEQVKLNQAFGAFAVSYYQVGINTAQVVAKILGGARPEDIEPIYPSLRDHTGFVSRKKATQLGIKLPETLNHVTVVE